MVIAALAAFGFVVGLLMLVYNGYVEDGDGPPLHTLNTAIPILIVAILLMALAIWRVRSLGPRAALVRLGLGVLAGFAAFLIGVGILYS